MLTVHNASLNCSGVVLGSLPISTQLEIENHTFLARDGFSALAELFGSGSNSLTILDSSLPGLTDDKAQKNTLFIFKLIAVTQTRATVLGVDSTCRCSKSRPLSFRVTEVVWEGGETETKADSNTMKKADNNSVSNTVNSTCR
ncbi:unnamed protein product [Camellia sinensis]